MVTLLAKRISVFNHKILGIGNACQSLPTPFRTMNALANAMKNISMAPIPIAIPVT
jgi:hypothetical protein